MEARAQDTDNRETAPSEPPDAVGAAAGFAAAYERYATGLRPLLLDLVGDDDKASRITQAAFIAAFQALAAEGPPAPSAAATASALTAVGPCPKLGYADDASNRYSRATQLHRCYASGSPVRLSTQEQTSLCLTGRFGSCPRFNASTSQAAAAVAPSEPPPSADAVRRARLRPHSEAPALASRPVVNWVAPDATAVDAPAANQLGADLPTADPVGETPVDAAIRQMRQTAAHPSNGRPVVPMHVLAGAAAAALFVVALAAWLAVVFRASDASDRLPTEDEVARRLVASGAISVSAVDDAPALGATGGAFAVVASARGASEAGVLAVPVAPVPSDLVIVPAALPQVPAGAGAENVADSPPAIVRRAIHAPVGFTTTNLRERPSTAARSLALLGNGATVDVLDGTANADGFIWLQTRTANGVVGWVVSTAVGA